MKRSENKTYGIVKGGSSGLLISLLVHTAAFLLAGMLVVFTAVKKEETKFVPAKVVERPKMKLKKPKVQVRKTAKPRTSTRIVTKVTRAGMPNIQLPEMGGMAQGLVGGGVRFELMPELDEVSLLGNTFSIGNDLVGTFYDLKRDRRGRVIPTDTSGMEWRQKCNQFLKNGWKTSTFARYYRSPRKLYATSLMIPRTLSSIAPLAFGDDDAVGALWMVHYKGQIVYPEKITFRFWGSADEFMVVRVDGELVLAMDWYHSPAIAGMVIGDLWESDSLLSRKYVMGGSGGEVGDWITMEANEPKEIEILIGDNGGLAHFVLAVEVKDVEYAISSQGAPILPAFKTEEPSHDLLDAIYKEYGPNEICLTNGPVFRDYALKTSARPEPVAPEPEMPVAEEASALRLWAGHDGKTLEAEFVNVIGDKAVLKDVYGKTRKIPLEQLSEADREYIELSSPPEMRITFSRNFGQEMFRGGFYEYWPRPPEKRGHFGVRIKQMSAGDYPHELKTELFAIGQQRIAGKTHLLLDRQETSFTLTRENQRSHEFRSNREVVLTHFEVNEQVRGETYFGYAVVVTDIRGKVVAVEASHDWLAENIDNLRKLNVGNYLDKQCIRTYPARPKPLFW